MLCFDEIASPVRAANIALRNWRRVMAVDFMGALLVKIQIDD